VDISSLIGGAGDKEGGDVNDSKLLDMVLSAAGQHVAEILESGEDAREGHSSSAVFARSVITKRAFDQCRQIMLDTSRPLAERCQELTDKAAAARDAVGREWEKWALPTLAAIWAAGEGIVWSWGTVATRDAPGQMNIDGGEEGEVIEAWLLFFACFGGLDSDMYDPAIRKFRAMAAAAESEDERDFLNAFVSAVESPYGAVA
jgi:hypothetical protein